MQTQEEKDELEDFRIVRRNILENYIINSSRDIKEIWAERGRSGYRSQIRTLLRYAKAARNLLKGKT